MAFQRRAVASGATVLAAALLYPALLSAQSLTIKREALALTDPMKYNVPLRTAPAKSIELTSAEDGYVRQVHFKPGEKVSSQQEALRLEDSRQKLVVERARANLQAAKIEQKIADAKKDEDLQALAKARLDAAAADLKIAELELERTIVKVPFPGELFRIHVVAGQFSRAGEPLMTLADTSSLIVEIPVDRTKVKTGTEVELNIENATVKSKIQSLLPPDARFEPLRNMVGSLSSAVVSIDNSKGEFFAGQTVYTKLIPKQPFAQVPTASISNQPDGKRQVQVLRKEVVRDIPVDILTQVGTDKVFVAGPFSDGDELILTSSQPLKDGQQVRPQTASTAAAATTTPGTPTTAPKTGF